MIKRSGVEINSPHSKNKKIGKETIDVCKKKQYTSLNGNVVDISSLLDAAVQGTVLYKPESDLPDTDWYRTDPLIKVTNETTAQAAVRLEAHGKTNIVALNFAAARNPGGGFLAGAVAQEEDLCRASGLYPCIKSKPIFYNENILCDDCYYTDNIIYSPSVPFFRDEHNLFLENPFTLSVITSPAPNLNGMKYGPKDGEKYSKTLGTRICRILDIAAAHGHKTLILGAWGCGAFGNSPNLIANMFKAGLMVTPAFEHVCFAVYDTREPTILFDTFKQVFA